MNIISSFPQDIPTTPKFFGRRKGKKIRPVRERLLAELLPKVQIRLSPEGKFHPEDLFSFPPSQIWLEVGFGGGEHLSGQSLKNPNIGFIGAEVFLNGVASLLAHLAGVHQEGTTLNEVMISPSRQDNVRVYNDDVRTLISKLPDNCLDRIFVLFPDPWPKKRHAMRRFIGPDNLPELSRTLKKGGELRIASDDMTYIRWSLSHLVGRNDFIWGAKSSKDWNNPPSDWIDTRYQQKAISSGRMPVYLSFFKTV